GALISGLSQPFVGHLYDRWGGRKLILLSLVLSGLCTALLALTHHLLFLLVVFGILRSMAQSGSSLSTTSALLSKWFHRRRATVMALNAAGASLGGLLLIPMTAAVIEHVGWRLAWAVLGLLVLGLAAPLAGGCGRTLPLGSVYALRGGALAALLLLPGTWRLWRFVAIMRFSWWATLPLTSSLTAEVYGLHHLGILNGVAFTGHQIGGA